MKITVSHMLISRGKRIIAYKSEFSFIFKTKLLFFISMLTVKMEVGWNEIKQENPFVYQVIYQDLCFL